MQVIKQGSIEELIAEVSDALKLLNVLPTPTNFSVRRKSTGTYMIAGGVATVVGMRARCLINTNIPQLWTPGEYSLSVYFTNAPEIPVLGPFDFLVDI